MARPQEHIYIHDEEPLSGFDRGLYFDILEVITDSQRKHRLNGIID